MSITSAYGGRYLDDRTYKVTHGDVINFPRWIPHGFSNIGRTLGRTLFTVIPGANFEKLFEELSVMPADTPPDMATVAEIFKRYDIAILAQRSA